MKRMLMLYSPDTLRSRLNSCLALFAALVLSGCAYSQKEVIWEPAARDFIPAKAVPPLYADNCREAPESITVPLDAGVLLRLKSLYRDDIGNVTLDTELYIPAGVALRLSESSLVAQTESGGSQPGEITKLSRMVYYGPRRGVAGFTKEVQSASQDVLRGWSAEEAKFYSGLPANSVVVDGQSHNVIDLRVHWEHLNEEQFTLTVQDVETNGHFAASRSILYRHVECNVFYAPLCS